MSTDTKTGIINTPNSGVKTKTAGLDDNQAKGHSVEIPANYEYGKVQGGSLAILYECFNAMIENLKYVMEVSSKLAMAQSKVQSEVTAVNVKAEVNAGKHRADTARNNAIGEMVGGAVGLGFTAGGLVKNYVPSIGFGGKFGLQVKGPSTNTQLNQAQAKLDSLSLVGQKIQGRLGELATSPTTAGQAPVPSPRASKNTAITKAARGDFSELTMKPGNNGKQVPRTPEEIQVILKGKEMTPGRQINGKDRGASPQQLAAMKAHLEKQMDGQQKEVEGLRRSMDNVTGMASNATRISGDLSRASGQLAGAEETIKEANENARKTAAAATQQIAESAKEKSVSQVNESYNQILQQLAALKAAGQEAARGG